MRNDWSDEEWSPPAILGYLLGFLPFTGSARFHM